MQIRYFQRGFFPAFALGLALLVGGAVSGSGQDNDKRDKHSRKQQEKSDRKSERQQERSDRKSSHQQEDSDHESRRQQRSSDQNSRLQQAQSDNESRRQQQWSDWNSRRQQAESDHNSTRQQEQRSDRRDRKRDNGDGDDRRSRGGRSEQRVYSYPNPRQITLENIWNNRQNEQRNERHYPTGQRRDWKQDQKARQRLEREQRRYARSYGSSPSRVYYDNNYYNDNFGSNGGSDWKQELLRLVIGNVIGDRSGGNVTSFIPQIQQTYGGSPYNYGNNGAYYNQPQRYSGIPYNDPYQPDYGYNDASYDSGSLGGGLLNSLPLAELLEQYTGGGIASELVGNFLAQGYDEGFLAGRTAMQNGRGDDYYQDPYVCEGGIYDPYSVSVGQNRQVLSEGYELGYQDALSGRNDYDPQSDGNTDLVSLLLSSVLGNV